MKTSTVLATLAVAALVLGLAAASCPCALSGKSVCGGGCSGAAVRPAPFIPAPRPQAVVRRQYVVVEQRQQPEEAGCYVPQYASRAAPAPAPEPCYESAPAPAPAPQPEQEGCYQPSYETAYQPSQKTVYIPVVPVQQRAPQQPCARTMVYKSAPAPKILYRPAPAPQPTCSSCYKPASSCGCQ